MDIKRGNEVSESFPSMKPRDIVTPSAALLGLIVTAFGILVALAGEPEQEIVKNFAFLFITVVVLFIFAVIFTALSSLLRKIRLWSCALIFYVVGWAFFGTIVVLVLIGYAYGIDALQLQLPQFNLELVSSLSWVVGIIAGFLSSWLAYRRISAYRKKISELSKKVEVSSAELHDATTQWLRYEFLTITDSLVILRSEIEGELRRLAKLLRIRIERPYPIRKLVTALKVKEILSPELAYSILFVYNVCSKAVHGEVLPEKDALMVQELGIKTLINLRKIVQKYERQ